MTYINAASEQFICTLVSTKKSDSGPKKGKEKNHEVRFE